MKKTKGIGYYLWRSANMWSRQLDIAFQDIDLTHSKFLILISIKKLSRKHDFVTQNMISIDKGVNINVVSRIVRTFEERGLIIRRANPNDTRAKSLELTTEGKTILEKARKRIQTSINKFFEPIGGGDELYNILIKLVEANELKNK